MDASLVAAGLAGTCFFFLSFFFALAESALLSLGKWRTQRLRRDSPENGERLTRLLEKPQDVLATLVLGNAAATVGLLTVGLSLVFNEDWPALPTLGGLLVLVLFGCEILPKTLAVRHPEVWSMRLAEFLEGMVRFSGPVRAVAQRLVHACLKPIWPKNIRSSGTMTDEEYEELFELAFLQGTLKAEEKEIILEIINLDRRTVTEVLKPRGQMIAIDRELSLPQMLEEVRKHRHRFLPVYDGTPDRIVGILDSRKLLLNPVDEENLEQVIELAPVVPESMNLLQLLRSLQQKHRGMAVVLDEFGGTEGIVTLQDILEELVGDLPEEDEDEDRLWNALPNGDWEVSGLAKIYEFAEACPSIGEVDEVESMGGLVVYRAEEIPKPGQHVLFRGHKLTVLEADERRVIKLRVERTAKGKARPKSGPAKGKTKAKGAA